MKEVRSNHFEQANKIIKEHQGYSIKTMGDSLMVAFRTAGEALEFSLKFYNDTGDKRVRIRIGINVGPVDIDEEDAFGSMINFAHRVLEMAKNAEVWISSEAKNHIDQELSERHKSLQWDCRSGCQLKGFEGSYTLWYVDFSKYK